jgi:hypothetical protein
VILRDNVRQDLSIKKDQRAQRLILCRRRQSSPHHQVIEKRLDVGRAELLRRLPRPGLARRERQKLPNPQAIHIDRILRQASAPGDGDNLFQQFHDVNIYRTSGEPIKIFFLPRPPGKTMMGAK